MLRNVIAQGDAGRMILEWIKVAALVIEILAVAIITAATLYAVGRFLLRRAARDEKGSAYHDLKFTVGRSLLIGLEVLVAADVIRTVALEATMQSMAVLGLLVLIRTFLGWSLLVEMEGRWPWQSRAAAPAEVATE
jgi:uncharacterized membrane protein